MMYREKIQTDQMGRMVSVIRVNLIQTMVGMTQSSRSSRIELSKPRRRV
jgi:hypothetical protein